MTPADAARPHAVRRMLAAAIDTVLGWVVSLIPGVGGVAALVYILTRDMAPYALIKSDAFKNRSLGKRIAGLKVVPDSGDAVTFRASIKRNMSLVVGALFGVAISPMFGAVDIGFGQALVAGPVGLVVVAAGLVPVAGETVLALTDPEGRRWGDRFAGTRVMDA